jgi:hypothetical protein
LPVAEGGQGRASQNRKSSALVRSRIIKERAKVRALRAKAVASMRRETVQKQAFRTVEVVPIGARRKLGSGHCAFALGPIVFCKTCGGTSSTTGGHLLKRACRGWAPMGTAGHVKALMRGKAVTGLYKRLLMQQCTPPRRLACKTRPVVKCQVPIHLICNSEADDVAPGLEQPPAIRLTRSTVLQGAAWRGVV